MDLFKFYEQYGKELKCPNIWGKFGKNFNLKIVTLHQCYCSVYTSLPCIETDVITIRFQGSSNSFKMV